jgi:hypothetical protein
MTGASQIRTPAAARCTGCGQTGHACHLDGDGAKTLESRGERRMSIKTLEARAAAARSRSFEPTCREETKAIHRFKSP